MATIPEGLAPDELTLEVALELLRSKNGDQEPVADRSGHRAGR